MHFAVVYLRVLVIETHTSQNTSVSKLSGMDNGNDNESVACTNLRH